MAKKKKNGAGTNEILIIIAVLIWVLCYFYDLFVFEWKANHKNET